MSVQYKIPDYVHISQDCRQLLSRIFVANASRVWIILKLLLLYTRVVVVVFVVIVIITAFAIAAIWSNYEKFSNFCLSFLKYSLLTLETFLCGESLLV